MKADAHTQARFVDLLQAHRPLLYKVVRMYGRSPADRQDLAQEVIANIWRAFPHLDQSLKFSTWMYRIALNVAISWIRRQRTQTRHVVPVEAEVLGNVTALDEAVDSDDVALLYMCIERYEELDRGLLLLYLDGASHQDISDVLGLSVTNVGTRISRLKERLANDFRNAGHLDRNAPPTK